MATVTRTGQPTVLANDLSFNCYRLSQLIRDEMVERLKKLDEGLTPEQWHLLLCLASASEGLTPSDLAIQAMRDKTTISRMLDVMERHNLIVRLRREGDGRSYLVGLSSKSRGILERARAEGMTIGAEQVFAPLNNAEREFLLALIHKCRRGVGDGM
jgi:MarR family transcriptional regulator, organic hydroperoxide resistance regulator